MRVIVSGRLRQWIYEAKEGDKRTVFEVEADDVAVSLKFATAKVAKAARSGNSGITTTVRTRACSRKPHCASPATPLISPPGSGIGVSWAA